MSASTTAAIAALVFAVLAFLIAFAQASQQYAASGQLIRLCDSVVYGGKDGWPGQGRRVWSMRQFRFRILYSVPRLIVDPHLIDWILETIGLDSGPRVLDVRTLKEIPRLSHEPAIGEATWVSLARALSGVKPGRRFVKTVLIEADADRCPADLPNVAIAVSMRDMAIFGLMLGMNCLHASFKDKRLAMQGEAGSLHTTQHPVLGTLVRFETSVTPPKSDTVSPWLHGPDMVDYHTNWMRRIFGFVTQRSSVMYPLSDWSQWIDGTHDYLEPGRHTYLMGVETPWEFFSVMDNHPARYATPWNAAIKVARCACLIKVVVALLQEELETHAENLKAWPLSARQIWCSLSCSDISIPTGVSYARIASSEPEQIAMILQQYCASYGMPDEYLAPPTLRQPGRPGIHNSRSKAEEDALAYWDIFELDTWLVVSPHVSEARNLDIQFDPELIERTINAIFPEDGEHPVLAAGVYLKRITRIRELVHEEDRAAPARRFLLVSLLRTAKMALRVTSGIDTLPLQEILRKDFRAYLL